MNTRPRVTVFGAAGYAGMELVKLLASHPGVELAAIASDAWAGRSAATLLGTPRSAHAFVANADAVARTTADSIALLAIPQDAAAALAPELRRAGARVIDLSHAHRGVDGAVYGLASLFGAEIAGAAIVANPGCYATAVITALAPLVRRNLIEPDVIVSASSGVTGAGKSVDPALMLGDMYGEVRAYKVLRHQHVAEIEAALARVTPTGATAPRVLLTTHLLPIPRGIFATLTVRLRQAASTAELAAVVAAEYADDPFVAIAEAAEGVTLRNVVGTNLCQLGVASQGAAGSFAVITAAIDNLLKGAAGQAVENLNTMLDLPRATGLDHLPRHA